MKKNLIRAGGLLLLVLFFALVIMSYTGIYEYQVKKKTDLTTENIEKFEKDIKEGKDVEVKDYLEKEKSKQNSGQSVFLLWNSWGRAARQCWRTVRTVTVLPIIRPDVLRLGKTRWRS